MRLGLGRSSLLDFVQALLVSTATPMALLLLGNTSSESKITRLDGCFFLSIAGEN